MKQTSKIKAVELVRKIRDAHAKQLANKTPSEIMEFYNRAGNRAKKNLSTPRTRVTAQEYPPGWNERRVRQVLDYYDSQTDEEAAAEIEAGSPTVMMKVPSALVPAIRRLIARHRSARTEKANDTTSRTATQKIARK